MTKLSQDAVEAARRLPSGIQDEIEPIIPMSEDEDASFAVSRAQAARGDFASEARMNAIWSKDLNGPA